MKKVLGGCLLVALLALLVGGAATWWLLLRPAWNAGSQFIGATAQLAELAQLDARVSNRTTFAPPADGRIPAAGLTRFLAVQQTVKDRVGPALATLDARLRAMPSGIPGSAKAPELAQVLGTYGDIFGLVREAKLAQVDALNAQNLSLAEYRWIRGQAYAALARDALRQGNPATEATASDADAERLAPHRQLLKQTAVVAWLGL